MIWYLFDNAKNIRSRIDYIWKISWLLPLFFNTITLRYKYIKMVADLWCNNGKIQIFYILKKLHESLYSRAGAAVIEIYSTYFDFYR